eukprot:g32260.t1
MAADGTVLTGLEDWERYVAPVLANQKTPLNEFPSMVSLGDHPDHPPPAAPTATRRSRRSTSPEHVARCAERLGSQRLARRQCARCGWIAHRARLLEVLRFSKPHEPHGVATSETAPWVAEQPDRDAFGGVPPGGRRTAFSDFTFGASMPGLLFQPLLRHGNHAMRQVRRQQRLEVLVMTPSEKAMGYPPSAGAEAVCRALGYSHEVASNNEALLAAVQRFQPDLLVSILWPRRVPKEVLDLCPESLNFHPSLLPKHRGSLTQFWAIFEGDDKAATKILHREEVELSADETALSLSHKIALTTEKCFKHIMELYFTMGLPEGEDWDIAEFPYHYRRLHEDRNSSDGFIDPTWPDEKVDRFIRATYFPPYAAARLRRADGAIDGVVSLKAYQALRAADEGATSAAPAAVPFWGSSSPVQVAQLELFARAAAFFERHGPGSSVRRLWDRKCEEAIEYWKERPQGTDVIAEAQEAQKAVAPALARAVCAAAALGVPPEEEVEEDVFEGALAVLQHKKAAQVRPNRRRPTTTSPASWRPAILAALVLVVAIIASLLDNVDESRSLARRVPVEGGRCMDGSTSNLYLAKGYASGRRRGGLCRHAGG